MSARRSNSTLSAAFFALCMSAASSAVAQSPGKQPLFTTRPYLCIGRGFVAMVPSTDPPSVTRLVVVTIDSGGIEAPQTLTLSGNEFFGMQCPGSDIELLVRQNESDHFSVLPFSVRNGAVEAEQREDIDWSISRKDTVPPSIERRMDEFHQSYRAGAGMRGDWYLGVNAPEGRISHRYEIHFVETEILSKQSATVKLVVTLLEETPSRRITQSVPLIKEEVTGVYD